MKLLKFPSVLILILVIKAINCQIDPITQNLIDGIFESFLPLNNIPGLGLSIVKDGETLYTQGYGNQRVQNSVPVDNKTLFLIGSITKSFTATIVVKTLSEKFPSLGEQVLDIPIVYLIPSFNFTLSDRFRSESTTFRDILAHRGCLETDVFAITFGAYEGVDDLVYRHRYAQELCQFRSNYVYNNGHVTMAGQIIAAISGVPYLDMMADLFSQLGMTDTVFLQRSDDHNNMPNRALGYYFLDGELRPYNSELFKRFVPFNAAGGILSTTLDMAKYMEFHLSLGRVGNTQVVPEEVMKWFQINSNSFAFYPEWNTKPGEVLNTFVGYSLALIVGTYDGYLRLSHDGYLPPFNSYMSLYPALNLGIFTTTNGPGPLNLWGPSNSSHITLHDALFEILRGESSKGLKILNHDNSSPLKNSNPHSMTWTNLKNSLQKSQPRVRSISKTHALNTMLNQEEITGHYGNGLSGELDIILKTNSTGQSELYMDCGTHGQAWIRSSSSDTLFLDWDSDFIQDFYTTGEAVPYLTVQFVNNTMALFTEGVQLIVYYKDQRLEDLPTTPWSPDSCGPTYS